MKPYMGYSRIGGAYECAILIFAHSAREAKKVGWGCCGIAHEMCDDEFTDFTVNLIRHNPSLMTAANPELLARDKAHVIDDPPTCKRCEHWGEPMDECGICESCRQEELLEAGSR